MTVAVLFACADSHCKALDGLDLWDIQHDGRTCTGRTPLVAADALSRLSARPTTDSTASATTEETQQPCGLQRGWPYQPINQPHPMKHHNKLTTSGGFRLIRAFSIDHNTRRLTAYADRLRKTPAMQRFARRLRLRRRFSSRFNKGTGNV